MKTTLILVRHGETLWNVQKRIQGRCNSPLTSLGRQQAKVNGEVLERENVKRIVASPAGRVKESLKHMSFKHRVSVRFDDRLVERNMGLWEQLKWDVVRKKWQADYFRCRGNPNKERPPHGESLNDVEQRVDTLLREILSDKETGVDETPIALVSHGGTTRSILGWLGILAQNKYQGARFHNDVIYRITIAGGQSRICHYRAGDGPYEGVCTATS